MVISLINWQIVKRSTKNCNHCAERESDLYTCALCKRIHPLRFCRRFLRMSIEKREEVVDRYNYCINCLAKSHDIRSCVSMDTCRKCDRFHHTLLHPGSTRPHRFKGIKTSELRQRQHQRLNRQHHHQRKLKRQNQSPRRPATAIPSVSKCSITTTSSSTKPPRTNLPSTKNKTSITTPADMKVIVDAIRSLATILSAGHEKSTSG